jgi:hypothetical protein
LCPSRVNNVKSEGRKEVVYTFTDPDLDTPDGALKLEERGIGPSMIKLEYETSSRGPEADVKGERSGTPLAEIKPEPESPIIRRIPRINGDQGSTKLEIEEPGIGEAGVLDILDQVDGSKDVGADA